MGKFSFLPLQIFVIYFLQFTCCVRHYPDLYFSPWRERQPLQCPAARGQFSHPRYCDQFLNCWDNVVVLGQCNGGLVFNEKISACDYPRNVDCTGKENSQSAAQLDPRCGAAFGTFPNPQNCSEYIICQSGIATIKECPENTYYNQILGVCTYERDPSCVDNIDQGYPQQPVAAGSPTVKPPPEELPLEPKPPLNPSYPSSTSPPVQTPAPTNRPQHPIRPKPPLEPSYPSSTSPPIQTPAPTNRPQHPIRPKPPLEPETANKPEQESTPEPQLQESDPASQKPATVNLKPKPALKPEGAHPEEQNIGGVVNPEESPTPSIPPLKPGSFKPGKPPGPSNVGPSTTPEPVDGVDDPNILFPFLPPLPELFRCPVSNAILPIMGDCNSVIVCIQSIGHYFRCPQGKTYDLSKGRCSFEKSNLCNSFSSDRQSVSPQIDKESYIYAYLPMSHLLLSN